MRNPDYPAFLGALPHAAILARRKEALDAFRHQYREEIFGLLTMLHRIGLVGTATTLHPAPPLACDICVAPLEERQWFIEGQMSEGTWASMCPQCFLERGHSIGLGRGELYTKVDEARWRLVSGGDPDASEEVERMKS
jgi:hypothetical protein